MKKILTTLLVALVSFSFFATSSVAQDHTFVLGDSAFLLDGKPFQIISGELHYTRIPEAYWKDRLHKAKAMGLNAVSIYCMWNAHEPKRGVWDFSGRQDVRHFVELAQEEGLYVILRPGPYVCAEWEFGGYPWWLMKDRDIRVRTKDPEFMKPAKKYIMKIGAKLADLQISNGGPIIMVQVENEYGSFGHDLAYMKEVEQFYKDAGFTVPFFTADGAGASYFKGGVIPGVLPGANGSPSPQDLKKLVNDFHGGKGPYFIPELYPGWLDHWGEKFQKVPVNSFIDDVKDLLDAGVSINFYMWHGGTNFAFMNGANYNGDHPIQPDITSYDYDAPLSEAGVPTEKYKALRELILNYLPKDADVPPIPDAPHFISIPDIQLTQEAALFKNLPADPVQNAHPLSMEDLNQGYGYVLYRTTIKDGGEGVLQINGLRDYAQVFVDGKRVGTLNRMDKEKDLEIKVSDGAQVDILVENLGRINYGRELMNNRKGIIGEVTFAGEKLIGWKMFGFPFKNTKGFDFVKNKGTVDGPVVYKGTFQLDNTGDTFLDMRKFGKGIVFVNGHNLGRYWKIGPQQTLYLPGPWLREGKNTIVIFEQLENGKTEVSAIDHPILDDLQK